MLRLCESYTEQFSSEVLLDVQVLQIMRKQALFTSIINYNLFLLKQSLKIFLKVLPCKIAGLAQCYYF